MDRKLRVAVVGTGKIATAARIPALLSNKDVELVALVDTEPGKAKKTAKKLGVKRFFASVDDLFAEEELDAVAICTPPSTHADLAVKAMNHGAHVICEKPMANTLEDGKQVFQVSKAKSKILVISSQRRLGTNYRRARALISNGAVGHPYCISETALSANPLFAWGKSSWYFQPEGGGVLLDLGPHCFDTVNFLFDCYPIAISAHNDSHFDSPVEDVSHCIIRYPENRVGFVLISWLASVQFASTMIHGTAETMQVNPKVIREVNGLDLQEITQLRESVTQLAGMKFPDLSLLNLPKDGNILQRETSNFIQQIRNGETYSRSALNALNVLATIEAAKKSSSQRKEIVIETFNE